LIKKIPVIILLASIVPLYAADAPLSDRLLSSVGEVREDAVTEFNQLPHETQERFVPTFMVGLSSDDPDVHDLSASLLKKLDAMPQASTEDVPAAPEETPVQRKTREQQSLEEIRQVKTDRYKKMQDELEAAKKEEAQSPSAEDAQGDKKTDPIRDALLDGLTDPTPFVRSRSARRLAGLQPPMVEAIPALTKMLGDSDVECRGSAAGALGAFGPAASDAIPQLEKLDGDSDPNVRAIAMEALRQIRG
jgi:hypothetical protein